MKLKGVVSQITNPAAYNIGNLARIWIQSQYHVAIGDRWGQITFSPTWQKFPHAHGNLPVGDLDAYFRHIKDSGKEIIGCIANGFNKQFGVALKSLPKDNPSLDKTKKESYLIYTKLVEQFILRYGSVQNDSLIDIAEYGNHPDNPQSKVSGLNLIGYVQLLNEVNGYSGADTEQVLTGNQYATLYDHWCERIWAIDPNMKIISAPTARFDESWLNAFTSTSRYILDSRCDISANIYTFGGCGVWGKCDAIKPEDSDLIDKYNNWLVSKGKYGWITEFGCNSEKMSDLGYPEYGLDAFQSQAKYAIDYTNIALSKSNIRGVALYKMADDKETRFAKTGLRYEHATDPPAKPSYPIVKAAFENQTNPTMKALYSNNPQRTGQIEITPNFNFPVQAFTIEIKDVLPAIELQLEKNGTVVVARRPEGQAPLDLLGSNLDGTAKLYSALSGSYKLTVWKSGVPTVFTFTVGSTTTPIAGTKFSKDTSGKITFEFADLSKSVVTPD